MNFRVGKGFTIVELLIVVVVIAILAAITIVAYNGITKKATESGVQEALAQVNKKILLYHAEQGAYPTTLGDVGITNQAGSPFYNYTSDNGWYQLTVSDGINGSEKYNITSTTPNVQTGAASGNNLVAWDKDDSTTTPILTDRGAVIDASVFRTSKASIRIPPNGEQNNIRATPITGSAGQVVRVGVWIKTDPNWNGTNNNSKIRFAVYPSTAYLSQCSYAGVKTTWTYIPCSYTLTAANPSIMVQFINDGSVGNIWLDDISVSVR